MRYNDFHARVVFYYEATAQASAVVSVECLKNANPKKYWEYSTNPNYPRGIEH